MIWIPGYMGGKPHLVTAIYRDVEHGCTSFEVVGGQKTFLRVWDQGPVEWGWVVNDAAECVLLSPIETLR